MQKKEFRLEKKDDIVKIIRNGNKIAGKLFLCKFLENGLRHCRFTVVISKKVEKSAVRRNKCKRRIYEVIRNNVNDICQPEKSHDVVILTNQNCVNAPFSEIEREIKKLKI